MNRIKNSTKNILTTVILITVIPFAVNAQTNVSGGIYANTTWTLAGNPYIVVDTVVVFPGITLTIEPGVTVKFDDGKYMEIRQGTLIAAGTASDSITFTSNSGTPSVGIYQGIVFNFATTTIDYCIFKYAGNALNFNSNTATLLIQHSFFYMNNTCVPNFPVIIIIKQSSFYNNNSCFPDPNSINVKQSSFYYNNSCIGEGVGTNWVDNAVLDSCTFSNNNFGVYSGSYGHFTNCTFLNNSTVFKIRGNLPSENHLIKNCIFCNNRAGIYVMGFTVSTSDRDSLINCNFSNNGIAISSRFEYMAGNILTDNDTAYISFAFGTDLIFNNYFFHNQVGMLYGGGTFASFSNNYICNNSNYNIIYTSSGNGSIPPVCFCDTDSATIRSTIYDGYVDISRGLLNFSPFVNCDSSAITALPPIDCQTVISTQVDELSNHSGSEELVIYPNPVSDYLTVHFKNNVAPSQIWIINLLGEVKYGSSATGAETNLNISSLAGGIYFVEVAQGNKVSRERFVKQ